MSRRLKSKFSLCVEECKKLEIVKKHNLSNMLSDQDIQLL